MGERREVRFGPFVFVGGWRGEDGGRWSHRYGEPRGLALVWVLFVLVASGLPLLAGAGLGGARPEVLAFSMRSLGVVLAVGATVGWAMLRLSQARPARMVRSVVSDGVVLASPVGALLAPVPVHVGWSNLGGLVSGLPAGAVWSAAVFACGWWLLCAGVVCWGWRGGGVVERALAMVGVLVLVLGGVCVGAALPIVFGVEGWVWSSVLSGVWVLLSVEGGGGGWGLMSAMAGSVGVVLMLMAGIGGAGGEWAVE